VNKKLFIGVCLLQTLLFITGCKKRDDLIALNTGSILPTDLFIVDSLSIASSTVREDSIPSQMLSNQQLAGKMNDPLFGVSEASIFTDVRLVSVGSGINATTGADSAFLFLTFTSDIAQYGNLNSNQEFTVYELSEELDRTKTFYSTDSVLYNPTPIGSYTGTFNLKDSLSIKKDTTTSRVAAGIKIQLTKDFANKLINATANDVITEASFRSYLKGICIIPTGNPSSGQGAIVGFNFNNKATGIHVYYDGGKYANFLTDSACRKFSQYKIASQADNITYQKNNPSETFDTTFVQALTGAKTHFRFPTLFSLVEDQNIFIHKAELIIPVYKDAISTLYRAPSRLLLTQPDETTGRNLNIIDIFSSSYGGQYDAISGQYSFVITRHIQELFKSYVVNGDDFNFGLYLTSTIDLPITPARILIDTRKDKPINEKLRLVIMYSKL